METITTGKGEFLFVAVHSFGVNFFENMGYLIYQEPDYKNHVSDEMMGSSGRLVKFLEKDEDKSAFKKAAIKLPEGNYTFIAVLESGVLAGHEASQNIDEKRAALIVDDNGGGCWDNYRLKKDEIYTCTSAMQSFKCLMLLVSHNLKGNTNYAILKKV